MFWSLFLNAAVHYRLKKEKIAPCSPLASRDFYFMISGNAVYWPNNLMMMSDDIFFPCRFSYNAYNCVILTEFLRQISAIKIAMS